MCGIYGFVFRQEFPIRATHVRALLSSLVRLSESRGKEAAGLALCHQTGMYMCKEASRGTTFMRSRAFGEVTHAVIADEILARSSIAGIGHTRLVTNGSMERPANNQPVVRDGIIGVHNGIIVNDAKLFTQHGLQRTCEVDTEVFLALLAQFCAQGATIPSAVGQVFQKIQGTASIGLLFQDTPLLLLATNNGSLYTMQNDWGMIFASEHYILEQIVRRHGRSFDFSVSAIRHLLPGNGLLVDFAKAEGVPFSFGREPEGDAVHRGQSLLSLHSVQSEHVPSVPVPPPRLTPDVREILMKDHQKREENIAGMQRCTRCILPETMPFITFDEDGVCSFCLHHVQHVPKGEDALRQKVEAFRGNGRESDCLFPFSGGRDSSYGLHYVKNVLGLHPIAYSYDWGMLTDLGRRNQARMCGALGIEHLLISADIETKRKHIQRNVIAWLRRPDLGTVPLFMAGDKQYFYHLNRLKKQLRTGLTVYCENPLEQTNFKYGFCGVPPKFDQDHVYRIGVRKKLTLAFYYARHYAANPRLLNASLVDTVGAFLSTYALPHDYLYLFHFIPWEEDVINRTLREEYDWELADDTTTTWRIGDGTAAFYNYIYHTVAGFTENDTFRSNQIREGLLTRDRALSLVRAENQPRFPSLQWYGDTIGIDMLRALSVIDAMPKLYDH